MKCTEVNLMKMKCFLVSLTQLIQKCLFDHHSQHSEPLWIVYRFQQSFFKLFARWILRKEENIETGVTCRQPLTVWTVSCDDEFKFAQATNGNAIRTWERRMKSYEKLIDKNMKKKNSNRSKMLQSSLDSKPHESGVFF